MTRLLWTALVGLGMAQGAVVFSSGGPTTDLAVTIGESTAGTLFTLPNAVTVAGVRFWMAAYSPLTADPQANFSGELYFALHLNALGDVGAMVTDAVATGLTSTPTGLVVPGDNTGIGVVEFNLPASVNLTAGVYWLILHEGTSLAGFDGTDLAWQSAGPGFSKQGALGALPTSATPRAAAFELVDTAFAGSGSGTATPEPGTLGMIGIGMMAFFVRRMRMRRTGCRSNVNGFLTE
ncbi:MAG: PEP-CTERM sorting domain-containing protein [Bryobacterales bacterium]|nr:PEP-CTERM sorting domain-containing protein [Bryobacterales bacterium]